ncbi:MAG: T9SS type A sorting domain-containing protein [Muribaculaceae bacterium]|nr:T9SS type A sorting domain-containing protein [Muribaculaceae bacterium]
MKKIFTFSFVALAAMSVAAQTTGSIENRDHSVYCPSENGDVMYVSYDNLINASDASATITIGSTTSELKIGDKTEWGFSLPIGAKLQGTPNNTQFTINVTNVAPADTINTSVENVTGVYLYRQDLPTVTPDPTSGSTIGVTASISFEFSEAVNVDQIIYTSGSFMNRLINSEDGVAGYSTKATANVKEEYWSKSTDPATMNIRLNNVTLEGGWYLPDYSFDYTHEFPAETAQYVTYSPLNDEMTVWEVYGDGWGLVDLVFDGEVNYEDAWVTVTYTSTSTEEESDFVFGSDLWGDWSFWDGLYHVAIPLPISTFDEDTLEKITIETSGITSNNSEIEIPTIIYNNMILPSSQNIKGKTAGMNHIITTDNPGIVYDMQGRVVKNNVSQSDMRDLPKGLYILNGVKFVVK